MAKMELDIEELIKSTFEEHFGATIDRLRELAEADKDGLCVVLPCKVGDTVWRVIRHCTESAFDDCVGCERNESGRCKPKFSEQAFSVGLYDQIGKTVFLTREDAEAALRAGDTV